MHKSVIEYHRGARGVNVVPISTMGLRQATMNCINMILFTGKDER